MNPEESSCVEFNRQSWETNDALRNYREITMILLEVARVQISTEDGELVSKTGNRQNAKSLLSKLELLSINVVDNRLKKH